MRFYHIGFAWGKAPSTEKITRINDGLSRSPYIVDWMRYSLSCYVVFAQNADKVHIVVRELIDDADDQFVVFPIDLASGDYQGLLSGWIWDWLLIDRTRPDWPGKVATIRAKLYPPPQPPKPSFSELMTYLAALNPPKDDP
jgi:hypothetical protein